MIGNLFAALFGLHYKNETDEALGEALHTDGKRARKALEILDENNLNIFYNKEER